MAQYAILTDLDECVGCLACCTACKTVNNVPVGSFWNKVLRIGPYPQYEGAQNPDVSLYFLPVGCQHCADPECVKVCPTGASQKLADGTVQVDKSKCIGCQFCAMSCPYNVRYLNEDEGVVEKCTLCEQKIAQGELPQCVAQCGARARFFGDLEQGIELFEAPGDYHALNGMCDYDSMGKTRITFGERALAYGDDDIHHLPDVGNSPSYLYVLRNHEWKGGE